MSRSSFSFRIASCLLAFALFQTAAMARIYIADSTLNQINIYPTNASGNTPPLVTISGSNTGLSSPFGIAVDANYIYVANWENSGGAIGNTITVYPLNAYGNATPVATISGSNTGLADCFGIAVDANNIYVVCEDTPNNDFGSVSVFPKTANGNVAPTRVIGWPTGDVAQANLTGLADPFGIAVDANYIYVSVPDGGSGGLAGGAVCVFPLGASGNVAPTVELLNNASGLSIPVGIAVDSNYLYVSNESSGGNANSVVLYALSSLTSNSTPSVTIQGANTGLGGPDGIALNGSSIFVRNTGSNTETVYPVGTSGNATPTSTLGGFNSGIETGYFIAVDATVTIPATHFTVSAPTTVTSSSSFSVTVSALDASNNPVPSYSGIVHITASDVSATLPANATLTNGTGTFTVTLRNGGPQTVTATDTVTTSITGTSATIAVTGGTATHLTVSLPANVTVGVPFNATVMALDNFNNVSIGYAGTVAFTSTDGSAILPANSTLTAGTGTFSVTFNTTGFQYLIATDTVSTGITGNSAASVAPGNATHFSVSAPSSTNAGNGLSVTVTARDAANNTVTGYTGTVHFTSTDGLAVVPANATLPNGTGSFIFTLKTAGSQTVTATDTVTSSITGTSAAISVNAGAATHFVVSAPGTATAGTPITVAVTALDIYGNTATSYGGTVHFSSTDGSAILPGNMLLLLGTGTVQYTLETGGSQTVTATDTVTGSITGTSGTITVSAAATATHFSVSLPASATSGIPVSVTVTALSSSNATVTSYSGTVRFTSTDGSAILPANTTLINGTGTFSVTLKAVGTQTVTATDTVTTSITGTSGSVAVGPGAAVGLLVTAPGTATSGTAFTVSVTALDANQNIATGYTGTVRFTSTDGSATLPANATLTNGMGSFSATLRTAGGQTVTATDTVTGSITGTTATITVSTGPATHFSVSAPSTASAGTPINVTVTALNSSNVQVTGYGGTVHFTSTDGSATLPANIVLTGGSGVFSVTLKTAGSQTVTATDTVATATTGTSGTIAVSAGAASHLSVTAPSTATPGTPISVTVTALDVFGNTVTGYAGTVHFTSSDPSATVPANSTLTAGTGTFSVTLQTPGPQTVSAGDTVALSVTGVSGTITVSSGPATHFSVSAPASAGQGSPISVTVTALTASNATATAYAGTVHFTSTDGSATLPANATLTNGTGTFPVTLQTIGSQTVTATDTVTGSITGTSGTITVSLVTTTHFSVSAPSTSPSGGAISVTVTALNSSNATVTTYAGTVRFTSSDAAATLPTNSTLTNGIGTFTATLRTVGTQTVTATDTVTTSITGTSGAVTISPASQTISFPPIGNVAVGTAVTLVASASSGLPVTFSVQSGNAAITGGNQLTVNDTNPVVVLASQAGNTNYSAAASVTQSVTAAPAGPLVGVGGIGVGGASAPRSGLVADASGQTSTLAAYLNGSRTGGTLVGYIASISAGFTANFTLTNGQFTTTTTTLTGGASLGETLTFTGTLSNGVLSGSIVQLGLPFSVTLDPATGASSSVSGLYAASGSSSGSVIYSVVGTQGELFVLAISPGLVSAGVGTVNTNDTFTVTTGQGTTISGSVNSSTSAIAGTETTSGGAPISFSGESSGNSPTVSPAAQSVASGSTATLTVSTTLASPSYQWQFNSVPIVGATGATLTLPNIGTTQAGDYSAVVTSGGSSLVSNSATVTVTYNAWLANLSARAYVAPTLNSADVLIAGFVTVGPSTKQLLVRGVGPGLQSFNVPGYLPNPSLTIYSGSTPGATLTSWSSSLSTTFANLGAFPLTVGSLDTATLNTFSPGAYTAIVSPADGKQSGIALVELYDADSGAPTNRLANISGRAYVGTGADTLVGGFVVNGTSSETVLIRAVGPQLGAAPFNVPGTLAKPLLQVFDTNSGGNRIIAQIEGWGGAPTPGNSLVAAGIQPASSAVMSSVGAFSLTSGSADSALVLTLPPGAYTVEVSGADGGSGIALVEIYEVQ